MKLMVKKPPINWDLLEHYGYMFKRAITNREPKTAWDACASLMNHFEQTMGEPDQLTQDSREIDSDWGHENG